LADYLLRQPHGGEKIRAMIIDDIHDSLCGGRIKFATALVAEIGDWKQSAPGAISPPGSD
ncbi:MAG: hypothetical protein WCE36_23365, partial [Pseudolabrys sp.]